MNYVITQEDFDVNPLVTQLGLTVGDTISFTKEEAPAEEVAAPTEETPEEAPAPEAEAAPAE